jgi:uncharacterized protein YndB with AHSA1/START domain
MNDIEVDDTTLRLERLIAAPPELVFGLWTEPATLAGWWAPEGYAPAAHALDTRPGGHWRTSFRGADNTVLTMSGVYRVVEPPRRLAFSWAWEDASGVRGHETEVTVSFEAAPGGTRLVLLQQRFESKEARDHHDGGWSAALDRLARLAIAR